MRWPKFPTDWPQLLLTHIGVLAGCLYAGWYVVKYGTSDVPVCDEWYLLADWHNSESTLPWLWKHHFDHRYPIGKAVWLATLKLSGFNFRAPMFVTVALQTASSILCLWMARSRRGHASCGDLVFPMILLNLGHSFNFIMGYQVTFALFVYAVVGWLWCQQLGSGSQTWRWLILSEVYAAVAVMSGGFGIVFTVVYAGTSLWMAAQLRKSEFRKSLVILVNAVCALTYTSWIWQTRIPLPEPQLPSHDVQTLLDGTLCYLSSAWGTWYVSSAQGVQVAKVVSALVYVSAGLAWILKRRRSEFELNLAGVLALGVGLGLATTWVRGVGISTRFVTSAALWLCASMLVIPDSKVRWLKVVIISSSAYFLVFCNHQPAIRHGYQLRTAAVEFRHDVESGYSPMILQGKYEGTLLVVIGGLSENVTVLKARPELKLGSIGHNFDTVTVPVPMSPIPFDWTCTAKELADPPRITIPDPTEPICGLQLTVTTTQAPGWQRVAVTWFDSDTKLSRRYETFTPWLPCRQTKIIIPMTGHPSTIQIIPLTHLETITVNTVEWLKQR